MGTTVTSTGITFPDATTQTSAASGGITINAEQWGSWTGAISHYGAGDHHHDHQTTAQAIVALEAYSNDWLQTRLDVSYTGYTTGDTRNPATVNMRRAYRTYT